MTNQTNCNYRTPYKPQIQYYDEQVVIINGVEYQRVEKQKPQTLLEIILNWWVEDWTSGSKTICEELVKKIENEWLPAERFEDGEDYNIGWNDCIQHLKENLK